MSRLVHPSVGAIFRAGELVHAGELSEFTEHPAFEEKWFSSGRRGPPVATRGAQVTVKFNGIVSIENIDELLTLAVSLGEQPTIVWSDCRITSVETLSGSCDSTEIELMVFEGPVDSIECTGCRGKTYYDSGNWLCTNCGAMFGMIEMALMLPGDQ